MPVPQGSGVINRKSARQAVYEEVCDWIITGVLEPGEKILDSELGEYFHVSRTPVREALQQLQSQKLVLVMPGRATVVAPLDPMDIEQCYKPLAELQALAAELACGKLTQEDYHRYIAYVSQDNFLFDTTVMENIRMGKQNATDAEVMEAAKACGCHAFILGLENGYDTVVGGAGGHLSGGERQRIAIARAMLKNAPIIILDEATAFTDPENEAMIQSAVAKLTKGKTLIVIAHRLSTITNSDQIFVVEDGKIRTSGTHEELLAQDELYAQMWRSHISVRDTVEGGAQE